jgi:LmbE family N-acetylglucosaminyl deacetylase
MANEDLGDEFQTYMLVVAHPDDSEFSSAGTVARLKDAGKRVVLIQVTSGDRGSADATADPLEVARTRESEMIEAASRLEMDEVVFLRCPDGSLMPDLDLREKIVRMIRTHKPDVIITHDPFRPYALHPDHRAVGLATTDAVYPTARDPLYFPEHLEEGLEPHKAAEIWFFGPEHPDKVIDITGTFAGPRQRAGRGATVRARRSVQSRPDAAVTRVEKLRRPAVRRSVRAMAPRLAV